MPSVSKQLVNPRTCSSKNHYNSTKSANQIGPSYFKRATAMFVSQLHQDSKAASFFNPFQSVQLCQSLLISRPLPGLPDLVPRQHTFIAAIKISNAHKCTHTHTHTEKKQQPAHRWAECEVAHSYDANTIVQCNIQYVPYEYMCHISSSGTVGVLCICMSARHEISKDCLCPKHAQRHNRQSMEVSLRELTRHSFISRWSILIRRCSLKLRRPEGWQSFIYFIEQRMSAYNFPARAQNLSLFDESCRLRCYLFFYICDSGQVWVSSAEWHSLLSLKMKIMQFLLPIHSRLLPVHLVWFLL